MRRLSSAIVTASLLLQPLSAFALYETPGALLQAVRFDASAKMFSAEVHGVDGTTYVSAWIKGQMEGLEYADAKVSAQVTVDVEDAASHMKGRFKGSMMILDGQLYAKLDSMEGTFEDDVLLGTMRLATKKWVRFPVDADTIEQIQNTINQTGDPAGADDLYTLTRIPYQYGSSYTLTMRPNADMPLSVNMKIDTDYKDVVQVSKATFEGTAGEFSIRGQAKAERMKTPLSLTAPTDIVSFDWLMNHFMTINPGSLIPAVDFPVGQKVEDDVEDETIDDDIAPAVRPRTPRVRKERASEPVDRVNAGIQKPSRRLLKTGGNTNRK